MRILYLSSLQDFIQDYIDQSFFSVVASIKNKIPRKSLKLQTPLEFFLTKLMSTV